MFQHCLYLLYIQYIQYSMHSIYSTVCTVYTVYCIEYTVRTCSVKDKSRVPLPTFALLLLHYREGLRLCNNDSAKVGTDT